MKSSDTEQHQHNQSPKSRKTVVCVWVGGCIFQGVM